MPSFLEGSIPETGGGALAGCAKVCAACRSTHSPACNSDPESPTGPTGPAGSSPELYVNPADPARLSLAESAAPCYFPGLPRDSLTVAMTIFTFLPVGMSIRSNRSVIRFIVDIPSTQVKKGATLNSLPQKTMSLMVKKRTATVSRKK